MISTAEEFVLLLRKWASEPIWVSLLFVFQEGPQRGFVHLNGCVSDLDQSNSRFTIADENNNLASFSYADCDFAYESFESAGLTVVTSLPQLTGRDYEELAIMVTPSNATIAIYKTRE